MEARSLDPDNLIAGNHARLAISSPLYVYESQVVLPIPILAKPATGRLLSWGHDEFEFTRRYPSAALV